MVGCRASEVERQNEDPDIVAGGRLLLPEGPSSAGEPELVYQRLEEKAEAPVSTHWGES